MAINGFYNYPLSWKPDRAKLTRPVYLSLARQLKEDIASGCLAPGTRLPPQRELARFLGINFTTVTRAYKLCELKGLLQAVTGSGTFVASSAARSVTISTERPRSALIDLGFENPFQVFTDQVREITRDIAGRKQFPQLLDYASPTGMVHQKAAGVNWLKNIGVETDPDHLMLVSGTQNGLAMSLLALLDPGDRIGVDTYTYANFIELARLHHLQLVAIGSDEEGMRTDLLERQHRLNALKGVFLMPSCCNPTTRMISERRKQALAQVIRREQLILLEDDIHAFFTAGTVADYAGPLARLVPEQSVYVSGTSKPLCAGLRVAYLVYPDRFREALLQALFNVNVKTSSLDGEIITELILTGTANAMVKKKQELAAERNRLFFQYFPELEGQGHPLSFYRWLPIPDTRGGAEVEQAFQQQGIRVYHSDRFLCGKREMQAYLRVALSTEQDMGRLEKGLSILRENVKKA